MGTTNGVYMSVLMQGSTCHTEQTVFESIHDNYDNRGCYLWRGERPLKIYNPKKHFSLCMWLTP